MIPSFFLLMVSALFTSWTTQIPEIGATFGVLLTYPTLALLARRMHDRGRSAWWLVIGLIPGLGWAWAFAELALMRGARGDNHFGLDPLYDLDWHNYAA